MKKDNDQNPSEEGLTEDKLQKNKEKIEVGEIHTIPARFHSGAAKPSGKTKKNLPLIIIGAVAMVLVLGVVAAFMFQKIMGDDSSNTTVENQNQVVANGNINTGNQNSNVNLNENINSLPNLNSDLNTNTNQNSNANSNTNAGITLNTNTTIIDSRDSDRDSLTDAEEDAFGTNPNKPDTDSDGYSDGIEVGSGYNPAGSGRIEDMTTVGEFENKDYNYSILYPLSWIAQATDQTNKEVLFTSTLAEFVEVLVANNLSSLTAGEWYLTQYPELDSETITTFSTWNGEDGVIGVDTKTVYLATDDFIYIITYNFGTRAEASFRKAFEMMYKSFVITESGNTNSNLNQNINTNTNANQNTNTNTNLNQNSNTNSNTNTNTNTNSDQKTNTNTNSKI
ncbi:hypothetical protein KJ810_00130 [Patescibacteria group bacterium]|nr:hypothetical protein [Patescibacteria group bacterium]